MCASARSTSTGEPLTIEASGLEARVLQHEIDHLDGVLMLDRTDRGERARGDARLARAASAASEHRLHRHLAVRGCSARRGFASTARLAGDHAAGRGEGARPARVADRRWLSGRGELGIAVLEPERLEDAAAAIAALRPTRSCCAPTARWCASRCCRATRSSTCTLRCCRAGAARRRSSGRSWPATRETGVSIMRLVAELDAGPVCAARRVAIGPDDDFGSSSERLAPVGRTAAARGARRPARATWSRTRRARPTRRRSPPPTACSTRASRPRRSSGACARCTPTSARGWPTGSASSARAWRTTQRRRPASSLARDGRLLLRRDARERSSCARQAARRARDGRRGPTCAAMPSEARAVAYQVAAADLRAGRLHRPRLPAGRRRISSGRDRALAMHLAYGAVQRALTLDHLIEQLAGRPRRARSTRRCWRRCGSAASSCASPASAAHAVVNDAVELAKPARGHALVNAVLRRDRARARGAARARSATSDPAAASLRHSVPLWIVERWWEALGARRGAGAAGARQRARRELAAGEHAAHRRAGAGGRAARSRRRVPGRARRRR